jgi:hypothetical protein
MRDQVTARFDSNLARVRSLLEVYRQVARPGQGRQPVATVDVLRAATVFLHASLEEVLRNLVTWKYPVATAEVLDDVPLAGSHGRAKAFFLGKLVQHRDKSIQELLSESVKEHVSRFSVGNVGELREVLQNIGVDPARFDAAFPQLSALFERRHHIVHQADRNDEPGQGQHEARGLNQQAVNAWVMTVEQFVGELLPLVPD